MASFGLSFMPGAQSGDDERQGAPINQVQQAIKLLSFRLPRVLGGSALAPAPLLQGQGGMAVRSRGARYFRRNSNQP